MDLETQPAVVADPARYESLVAHIRSLDRCEIPETRREAVLAWAMQPVRQLELLHVMAVRALEGSPSAQRQLVSFLERRVSAGSPPSRRRRAAQLRRSPIAGGPAPVEPCDFTRVGAIGDIALAVNLATTGDSSNRALLLDGLGEIGMCLGAIESLNTSLQKGDLGELAMRVDALSLDPEFPGEARLGGERPGGPPRGEIGLTPRDGVDGFGIPNPCPPPVPDDCEMIREFCLDELIEHMKHPGETPDGSHVSAEGITGVSADACSGDTVVIHGSGFGDSRPRHIKVLMRTRTDGSEECEEVEVVSWSDKRIEVRAPSDVTSGCIGFLDTEELVRQRHLTNRANTRLEDLNDLLVCLKQGPIGGRIPAPAADDCPPCTDFNRVVAGPPVIQVFRAEAESNGGIDDAGWGGVTTVQPSDRLRLHWWLRDADTFEIRRVSPTGPTFAGATSVADPPGHSYSFGVVTHSAPETWTYELEAANSCGSVTAMVTIAATKDPAISLGTSEVTQGIQTVPATVNLIAEKRTVVRVFWNHGLGGFDGDVLSGVTGELSVTRNGSFLGTLHPINGSSPTSATAGATIDIPASPQRANVDDSLNFLVPAGWCRGSLRFRARARIEDYGAASGEPGSGISSDPLRDLGTFTFVDRNLIDIQYLRVRWRGSDNTLRTPSADDCETTLENGMQRVGAPVGSISEHPDSPLQPGGTHNNARMRRLLREWDRRHQCDITEAIVGNVAGLFVPCFDFPFPGVLQSVGESYWALMPGSFYRGRAADIPASTLATPARSAPDNTGWTANTLDLKAGHEMSHCLDQAHLRRCGAPGGDPQSDWPNNGTLNDVGFDIAENATVDGAIDIMSYCNLRWPMPARWNDVFGFVGA